MEMVKKAHLKPSAPDKNPTIGGPIKNPKKPMEDTDANAILAWPGSADLPILPYIVGITEDTPNPTNINPIVLVIIVG